MSWSARAGMMRRDVERAEIHPVGFDVGAFGDLAAHGAEDRSDLLHGAADRMDETHLAGARRQRGVEPLGREAGVEFGVLQFGAAGLDQEREGVLQPVQCRTALPPLLRRGLAQVAQQGGEPAVAAQRGDAHGVPGAQIGGSGQCCLGFGLEGVEVVGHGGTLLMPSWPAKDRPSTSLGRA